ncbi:hypothetical protein I9W82_001187 [Candida metapsilosis]|uniref:WSC domain-containing protein n=1 Tax=Candida metapsilosis TaxID=273372 RepID=A0A8H7ZJS5_9ASCO|nr:hypothetical protein I9W82_001187 [Candida metapsilosis]
MLHSSLFINLFVTTLVLLVNPARAEWYLPAEQVGCYSKIPSDGDSQGDYAWQSSGYCSTVGCPDSQYIAIKEKECICLSSLPSSSDKVDDSSCSISCPGYGQEMCGGSTDYSIFVGKGNNGEDTSSDSESATASESASTSASASPSLSATEASESSSTNDSGSSKTTSASRTSSSSSSSSNNNKHSPSVIIITSTSDGSDGSVIYETITQSPSTTTAATATATAIATATETETGTSSSSSSSSSDDSKESGGSANTHKKSSNAGAIAGGVVGGVVGAIVVAGLAFFLVRRYRSENDDDDDYDEEGFYNEKSTFNGGGSGGGTISRGIGSHKGSSRKKASPLDMPMINPFHHPEDDSVSNNTLTTATLSANIPQYKTNGGAGLGQNGEFVDPIVPMGRKRLSDGSLADEATDFSRKVLQVANPDES